MDPTTPKPRDPRAQLRILHAPGKAPNVDLHTLHTAEKANADSIGYSEVYKVTASLEVARARYKTPLAVSRVRTRKMNSPHGDAGDNPVSVRWDHHQFGHTAYKVDDPSRLPGMAKWGPERWLYRVDYRWDALAVTHIDIHPSPVFVGLAKWRRVMDAMVAEARKAQAAGNLVIVTGDLQSARLPASYFKRLGLDTWNMGVDWIAFDRRLGRMGSVVEHPAGMDHPWMLAMFVLVNPAEA